MRLQDNKVHIDTVQGFDVYFEALPEHIGIDDTYMEQEDIEEAVEKIDSGEWVYFCACVTVVKNGIELGSDYLGACIYESEEDFYIKYKDDYFSDMVYNAITEAKRTIKGLCDVQD